MMTVSVSRAFRDKISWCWDRIGPAGAAPLPGCGLEDSLIIKRVCTWILGVIAGLMLIGWVVAWRGVLLDPYVTADDSFQHLYFYHQALDARLLTGDPSVAYMPAFTSPLLREVYEVLAPLLGVSGASKLIQGIQFLLLALPAVLFWRSPRAGPIVGLVYVILLMQMPMVFERSVGGMARGFGYPAILLWVTGAMIASQRIRWAGVLLGALFYPSAMILALAAEGALTLFRGWDLRKSESRWLWAGLGLLFVLCLILVRVFMTLKLDGGSPPWLTEMADNAAFGSEGRSKRYPLPPIPITLLRCLGDVMSVDSRWSLAGIWVSGARGRGIVWLCEAAFLVGICALARRRAILAAAVLLVSALSIYLLARGVAYKLYIPRRYLEFAFPPAMIGLVLAVVSRPWCCGIGKLTPEATRGIVAVAGVIVSLIFNGPNLDARGGKTYQERARLFDHIQALPPDVTIAGHPNDLDAIPYFTGRGVVANYETLHPWMTRYWSEILDRGMRTVEAVYAADPEQVLAYAQQYGVTHWVINKRRLKRDHRNKYPSGLFRPLRDRAWAILDRQGDRPPALSSPPAQAILYEDEEVWLLDADALRDHWHPAFAD